MASTRRALLMSVFSLILCVTMLLSTTFAWFTDVASSKGNIVQTGDLDIEMCWSDELLDVNSTEWKNADGVPIFNYDNWEPEHTEIKYIKITNAGELALKWQLSIKATNEMTALADVIDVYYVNPVSSEIDSLSGIPRVGNLTDVVANRKALTGAILPRGTTEEGFATGDTILAIAFHMNNNVGNGYQNMSIDGFELSLVATQYAYENDSFGNQYDSAARHLVNNAYDLRVALAEGGIIHLGDDIVTDANSLAVPSGVNAVLNLNGYNIDCKANIAADEFVDQVFFDIGENASLTVQGEGNITMTTTGTDIGDDYMSCVFLVHGGNLTINEGVTVQNKEGVLTNGLVIEVDPNYIATYNVSTFSLLSLSSEAKTSVVDLNGATILSYYCAIRIRSSEATEEAVNVTLYADDCTITSLWNDPTGETEGHAILLESPETDSAAECLVFVNNCTIEGTVKDELAESGKTNGIYNNGDIVTDLKDAITVRNNAELKSALVKANNGKTVVLAAGEYKLPKLANTVKNITIIGTEYATIKGMETYSSNYFVGFTFNNINFTGDVKGVFSGSVKFTNCDFIACGMYSSNSAAAGSTVTIENCNFIDTNSGATNDGAAIHFGGKDNANVVVNGCTFDGGWCALGKGMIVSFTNCDFNGTLQSCYGSILFSDCIFDENAEVYIHPSTGATSVTVTLENCVVDTGIDIKNVCYFKGNNKEIVMLFVIDGIDYTTDMLTPYPAT